MMAPMEISRQTKFLSLPTEILAEVWTYLSLVDVKSLRLVCRAIGRTASPALFYTFTLYPHTESLNRLRELGDSIGLACHLYTIRYDCTFHHLLDSALKKNIKASAYGDLWERDLKPRVRRLTGQYIDSADLAEQLELVLSLQQILPHFPNLMKLSILEECPFFYDLRMPLFYSRILGERLSCDVQKSFQQIYHQQESSDEGNFMAMLFSITSLRNPPKKLELLTTKFGWMTQIPRSGKFSRCNQVLAALDELNLTYRYDTLKLGLSHTTRLQGLLKQATNLSRLVLKMGAICGDVKISEYGGSLGYFHLPNCTGDSTFQHDSNIHIPQPNVEALEPRLAWSDKIVNLELGALKCTFHELEGVLGHHKIALKYLKLSDLILLPSERDSHSPRGCLVRFIKWLQKNLKLKNISFADTLTNCGMQHWTLNDEIDHPPSSLYSKVTYFVVNGGDCPLDFVEIPSGYYDLGMVEYGLEVPWFVGHGEFVGDAGWRMKYYHQGRRVKGSGDPQVVWENTKLRRESDSDDESESEPDEDEDEDEDDED